MILFPCAKINIGLNIVAKRPDGYHDIETIFYPIHNCCDTLEFLESSTCKIVTYGLPIDVPMEKNLCYKAWQIFHEQYNIPPIEIHLLKHIPMGSGLGGGSADAAQLLTALNDYFKVELTSEKIAEMALQIGSDCPFFTQPNPMYATGRGEQLSPINLSLKNYWLVLANPSIAISTKEAYAGVHPQKPMLNILQAVQNDINQWKNLIFNDFEASIFSKHPEIQRIKQRFYELGATYAAMSGSGATVYGIFEKEIEIPQDIPVFWQGNLN